MRPEAKGGRNIFWRPHPPPPLSQGLDDRPPTPFPYLKVWIREGGGGGSGSATVTFCVRVFKPQTNDFSTKLLYNSNIYSRVSQHEPFFLSKVI